MNKPDKRLKDYLEEYNELKAAREETKREQGAREETFREACIPRLRDTVRPVMEDVGTQVSAHGHGFEIEERLEGHVYPSLKFVFRLDESHGSDCHLTFVCRYERVSAKGQVASQDGRTRYDFRTAAGDPGRSLGKIDEGWVREQLEAFIVEVLKRDGPDL